MNEQDRRRRISEAAYYRSERRGFTPNQETEDWLEAERELDAQNEPVPASRGMSQADSPGKERGGLAPASSSGQGGPGSTHLRHATEREAKRPAPG
jgi:hypothetical protein